MYILVGRRSWPCNFHNTTITMLPEMIKHYLSVHWWHLCMFLPALGFLLVILFRELGVGDTIMAKFNDVFGQDAGESILVVVFLLGLVGIGVGATLLIVK